MARKYTCSSFFRVVIQIVSDPGANPGIMAQQMFSLLVKGLVFVLVGGIAAGAHYLVRNATGSEPAAWAVTWAIILPCVGWALYFTGLMFRDLDLSRDVM